MRGIAEMKLWLVLAIKPDSMDTVDAEVVIAETEEQARSFAAVFDKRHLDSSFSTCQELTADAYGGDQGCVVYGHSFGSWWRQ